MAVRLSQIILSKINNSINYKTISGTCNISLCSCLKQSYKNYSVWNATKLGQETSEEQQKKKTPVIPKITLLQGNEISVTTLEEAQKLSRRRDLKLVKIVDLDTKTQRPIYKLMTGSEYHAEDIKDKEQKKKSKEAAIRGEKLVFLNYNVGTHDLEVHLKKIEKWIGKKFEVRVVISGEANSMQKAVSLYY